MRHPVFIYQIRDDSCLLNIKAMYRLNVQQALNQTLKNSLLKQMSRSTT